ncbi:MAG TPA: anti-sigma factor [Acidimicrobiia bacterium]|nr:anti-sigma factor [Acidimicrobiia bacterium]
MTSHDDRSRRTGEILAGTAVWADEPELLGSVLAEIEVPRRSRGPWMAAAAALALVAAVGSLILTRPAPVDFTLAGTELAPAASAEVRLVETPAGIVLRLEVEGLEPAAPGTYYQGWVVSDAAEVSVGTFHMRGGDGSVAFWSGVAPAEYPELIVTLQEETAGPARSDVVVMTGRA